MTTSDWLMVLAVLVAPLMAVQVQKWVENWKERGSRKSRVFEALMATRAARVSAEHVRALNMIEIEFSGRRLFGRCRQTSDERAAVDAWKIYLDHLNENYDEQKFDSWSMKGEDLFVDLLHAMGSCLGYQFDKVLLKRGAYTPVAHGTEEFYQRFVRKFFVDLAQGKACIPVRAFSEDPGVKGSPAKMDGQAQNGSEGDADMQN